MILDKELYTSLYVPRVLIAISSFAAASWKGHNAKQNDSRFPYGKFMQYHRSLGMVM